jgi:hypothetical protein
MLKIVKNVMFFSIFLACSTLTLTTVAMDNNKDSLLKKRETLIKQLQFLERELNSCMQKKIQLSNSIIQSKEELQNKPLSAYMKETFKKVYGPIDFISLDIPIPAMAVGFNLGAIIIKAVTYILFPITIPITTLYGIKQWRDAKNEDTLLNMGQIPEQKKSLTWQEECIDKTLNDLNKVRNELKEIDARIGL